jgi:copper chaperone NosL
MKILYLFFVVFFLVSCDDMPESGPVEIKWDRDVCERCKMAISDPKHAAQIRVSKTKVLKFDDIGDAILYLQDHQDIKKNKNFEIWVTDYQTGNWIDAQRAFYVQQNHTPMEFGFSAAVGKQKNSIDYQQMIKGVIKKEQYNLQRAKEEYERRKKLLEKK